MTLTDLFSGIGGFSLGFTAAGHTLTEYAETDPFCCRIMQRHWPEAINLGDIANVQQTETDILTAGQTHQHRKRQSILAQNSRNHRDALGPHRIRNKHTQPQCTQHLVHMRPNTRTNLHAHICLPDRVELPIQHTPPTSLRPKTRHLRDLLRTALPILLRLPRQRFHTPRTWCLARLLPRPTNHATNHTLDIHNVRLPNRHRLNRNTMPRPGHTRTNTRNMGHQPILTRTHKTQMAHSRWMLPAPIQRTSLAILRSIRHHNRSNNRRLHHTPQTHQRQTTQMARLRVLPRTLDYTLTYFRRRITWQTYGTT